MSCLSKRGVSVSLMVFSWLQAGYELVRLLIPTLLSLVLGALIFKKVIAPEFNARYEEAQKTITNLAKLAGVKAQEYTEGKTIEKLVAADLLTTNFPEWQALKQGLSPDTVERVETMMEENPEVALQLYKKSGHLIGGGDALDNEPATFG